MDNSVPIATPAGSPDPRAGTPRQRLLAHLAMLSFAALIAGSFTSGAMAVPHLAPAPLNAVRFVMATALLAVVAFGVARHPFALPPAPWRFGLTGFLMAIYFLTMFIALKLTEPVATSAVFTLIPLMTAAVAYVLVGQRSGPVVLLSLLIAGLGALWVIFRGDVAAILSFDVGEGELIYFVGCFAYAFYAPLLTKFSRGEPSLLASFFVLSASTLWIIAASLPDILSVDWLGLPPVVWWALVYLAVGPTALSFFLIQFASQYLPAAKVIAYGYLTPVFVIMLEGLFGHGWTSPSVAAGALVTVLGLVVLATQRDR